MVFWAWGTKRNHMEQGRWVRGVGKNSDEMFGQKLTSSEGWMGWRVVMMEKPVTTPPQLWPFPSDGIPQTHRRSQDFWLGGPKSSKIRLSSPKLRVIFQPKSEIRTIFSPKIRWSPKKKKKRSSPKLREVFRPKPLALLLLYCLITVMCAITEKKLQLNIVRLCCHNFLSLVEFWLGGARAPWAPPWLRLCSDVSKLQCSRSGSLCSLQEGTRGRQLH